MHIRKQINMDYYPISYLIYIVRDIIHHLFSSTQQNVIFIDFFLAQIKIADPLSYCNHIYTPLDFTQYYIDYYQGNDEKY